MSFLLYLTLSLAASYLISPYLLLTLLLPVSTPTLTIIVQPALILPPGRKPRANSLVSILLLPATLRPPTGP